MNKLLSLLTGFLILYSVLPLSAQRLIKNSSITGICYGSNKVNKFYIPPPKEFFRKDKSKSGGSITVNYTGFSTQAKAAMDFATSIWESVLPADTKITVDANWAKISTANVLAQTAISWFVDGSEIDALNPLALYPVALASKIAGKNTNASLQGDITLTVNSSVVWYLGTDGKTPTQRYDLVTVILHEICHGFGFYDSFSSDGTIGSYDFEPWIYDTFVENFNGDRLTDTLKFINPSTSLESQLIGDQIYFNGPLLRNYSSSVKYQNLRAKLYAPTTWNPGSSISHLDESETLPVNSLMTPSIGFGEAIHDPGKYTFSILGDIGWINTKVIHTPVRDTEEHLSQILLSVAIKSDTTYNHSRVGVVYSFDKFLTSDSLFLSSPNSNDSYNTTITIPGYNSGLQYYFFVEDCFLRNYRSPSLYFDYPGTKNTNNRYHVFIGTDTVKPVIIHTPATYYLQTVDSIKYNATVTDNLGVDSVYIEFKKNNGPSKFISLKQGKKDIYSTAFTAKSLLLKGHDTIEYRIFAVDTARVPNVRVLPKTGFFVAPVEEISSTISSYSTNFSGAAPDFFNIGFDISKPAGFSKYGLNSKHPYESSFDNIKSIEYTSILRHPFKFDGSGIQINYNEVVLVEFNELGSVFGSSGFYDYVIVEGSKNFGKTWFDLIDGYNCTLFPSWESAYKSSIVGNNSTYIGTESLLQKHTFLYRPSDKISAGDTMLLRFRLHSDALANGWGWVIEDLNINPLIDAVPEVNNNHTIVVYPNPGTGLIKISTNQGMDNNKPLRYSIYNAAGICMINAMTSGSSETLVDISSYPAGMYIIVLYMDDGTKTFKYGLIK
jgi:hypothetical protein